MKLRWSHKHFKCEGCDKLVKIGELAYLDKQDNTQLCKNCGKVLLGEINVKTR